MLIFRSINVSKYAVSSSQTYTIVPPPVMMVGRLPEEPNHLNTPDCNGME